MNQAKLFGLKVRAVRKAAKITQERAAESAKLNPKYLGQIERGEKRPSFEAIISLARALHVGPVVFFQLDPEDADEKTLRKEIERYCSMPALSNYSGYPGSSRPCWSLSHRPQPTGLQGSVYS